MNGVLLTEGDMLSHYWVLKNRSVNVIPDPYLNMTTRIFDLDAKYRDM